MFKENNVVNNEDRVEFKGTMTKRFSTKTTTHAI